MTEELKNWTKEDVDRLLANIDPEEAKTKVYAVNYYLDPGDPEDKLEPAVFIVWEWVRNDHDHNIKSKSVVGNRHMRWQEDALSWRKSREEYGDVGDHCLISEDEARSVLGDMGLNIDDGKHLLIDDLTRTLGYHPIILDEDPKWRTRRDAARRRKK